MKNMRKVTNKEAKVLLKKYMPLIIYHVNKSKQSLWAFGTLEIEDLEQLGKIAVIEAAASYDPDRGASLDTWVSSRLRKTLSEENRKSLHVPRKDWYARNTDAVVFATSINQTISRDSDVELGETEAYDGVFVEYETPESLLSAKEIMERMPEKSQEAIALKALGRTGPQIGEELGISRQRVEQLIKKERENKVWKQLLI